MTRLLVRFSAIAFCAALSCFPSFAQSSDSSSSQSSNPAPATSPAQAADGSSTTAADAKKTKKVWTNEDVNGLKDPVSVVGNSKNLGKAGAGTGSGSKADGQYIANAKKELARLQSQLEDTDKQLGDLKDFSAGKAAATSSGYQINKGYNRVPVDQQITNLEAKQKQLQGKIDALLDEARKKGVLPGDLR